MPPLQHLLSNNIQEISENILINVLVMLFVSELLKLHIIINNNIQNVWLEA